MTPSEIRQAAMAIFKLRQGIEQGHTTKAAAIQTRKRLEDYQWQAFLHRLLQDPLTETDDQG